MERKSKLSLSLTLTFIAMLLVLGFTSLAYAPPPNEDYVQPETFDSRPTAGGYSGIGTPTGTIGNVFDGNLATELDWAYGISAVGVVGYANVTNFKKPSDVGFGDFAIQFIVINVHYTIKSTTITDDEYRIVFYFGGNTYDLQPWIAANQQAWAGAIGGGTAGARAFTNVPKPGGGTWLWSDIVDLKVGIETRRINTNNFQRFYLHEIWITAHATPYPAGGTEHMYVQPQVMGLLEPGTEFYVEVYVTGVTQLWGYEILLNFDPTVLVAIDYFSCGPFVIGLPSEIGEDYVAVAYKTFDGDPYGCNGDTPIVRIYFGVMDVGSSVFHLAKSMGANVYATSIPFTPHDGYYGGIPEFPLGLGVVMLLIPAVPVVYLWRIRKKERD